MRCSTNSSRKPSSSPTTSSIITGLKWTRQKRRRRFEHTNGSENDWKITFQEKTKTRSKTTGIERFLASQGSRIQQHLDLASPHNSLTEDAAADQVDQAEDRVQGTTAGKVGAATTRAEAAIRGMEAEAEKDDQKVQEDDLATLADQVRGTDLEEGRADAALNDPPAMYAGDSRRTASAHVLVKANALTITLTDTRSEYRVLARPLIKERAVKETKDPLRRTHNGTPTT